MNHKRLVTLILGSFLIMPIGLVLAEEGGMTGGHFGDHGGWRGMKDLGITDDQKTQLKTVSEAQYKALTPLKRRERDLSIKLSDQLEDKASDSDVQRTLSDLKANEEAMKINSKRFESQKDTILTPTQRAHFWLMRHHHKGHGEWGHHEMMDHDQGGDHHDGGEHHDGDHGNQHDGDMPH